MDKGIYILNKYSQYNVFRIAYIITNVNEQMKGTYYCAISVG